MARYIDADAFEPMLLEEYERATWIEHNTIKMVFEMLSAMPTADVVEVTRCKDCMHTEIDKYAPAECQNRCKLSQQYHEPTFFCKCGEPRTDLSEWIHKGDADEQSI